MSVGIIGADKGMNASTMFALAQEREQQIKKVERKKRGDLLQEIADNYVDGSKLLEMQSLSQKAVKKKSKEFRFLFDYLNGFNLAKMAMGNFINPRMVIKLNVVLGSLINNPKFADMSFEDSTTEHFEFLYAIYVALKTMHPHLKKKGIDQKTLSGFVFASSEIGLRLSSMFVDRRQDM